MSEDGFTLAEALAALFMISLAAAGAVQGVKVIGMMQDAAGRRIAEARAYGAAATGLQRLFERAGPFRADEPDKFDGAPQHLKFPCGEAVCRADLIVAGRDAQLELRDRRGVVSRVTARDAAGARFTYDGAAAWPPAKIEGGEVPRLRAVALVKPGARGDVPLAQARIWTEQPAACRFDPVVRDCRKEAEDVDVR